MTDILKLEDPGASVTMLVQRVARAKSKFGEDYVFTGNVAADRQVSVYVPGKATERQLTNVLKVDTAEELVRRFLVISRSDAPGPNGKLYWNITFADQDSFTSVPPKVAARAGVATSGGRLLPNETGEEDYLQEPAPARSAAKPAELPLNGNAKHAPVRRGDVSDDERAAVEEKRVARRKQLRDFRHLLWEHEALFQLGLAARFAKEHPQLPPLVVTAESINAATSTDFIEFNRSNLL